MAMTEVVIALTVLCSCTFLSVVILAVMFLIMKLSRYIRFGDEHDEEKGPERSYSSIFTKTRIAWFPHVNVHVRTSEKTVNKLPSYYPPPSYRSNDDGDDKDVDPADDADTNESGFISQDISAERYEPSVVGTSRYSMMPPDDDVNDGNQDSDKCDRVGIPSVSGSIGSTSDLLPTNDKDNDDNVNDIANGYTVIKSCGRDGIPSVSGRVGSTLSLGKTVDADNRSLSNRTGTPASFSLPPLCDVNDVEAGNRDDIPSVSSQVGLTSGPSESNDVSSRVSTSSSLPLFITVQDVDVGSRDNANHDTPPVTDRVGSSSSLGEMNEAVTYVRSSPDPNYIDYDDDGIHTISL